jgi:hypothetical protein
VVTATRGEVGKEVEPKVAVIVESGYRTLAASGLLLL